MTVAVLLAACGGEDPSGSSSGTTTPETACAKDTRKDIFVAGIAKQSASMSVKIVESSPSPPVKGTNAMTLQVLDQAGKPVEGATVSVTPFMPDHAHGTVAPMVGALGEGKYAVSKLYFPMAGLWKITVTVQVQGAPVEEVAFNFCFEG